MMRYALTIAAACFIIAAALDYLNSISHDMSDFCSQWDKTYGDCVNDH